MLHACAIDRLDHKWGVDGRLLVEKLQQLTSVQALALIDAVERCRAARIKHKEINNNVVKDFFVLIPDRVG